MSKVYLVHSESGEYSDWSFVPLAVFTTREKAVEWIEGKRVPITRNNYYSGLTTDVWGDDKVECYARPTTTDGKTWLVTTDGKTWLVRVTEDGRKVVRGYDSDSWFIDELDLDPKEVTS